MRRDSKILYAYEPGNEAAKALAQSLEKAMPTLDIRLAEASLPGLISRLRSCEIAHFFASGAFRLSRIARRFNGQARLLQTLLTLPEDPDNCKKAVFSPSPIVLSAEQKQMLEQSVAGVAAHIIPPPAPMPDLNLLEPAGEIRQRLEIRDRLMILNLSDIRNDRDFEALIYVMRMYEQIGGVRLVLPFYHPDAATRAWRGRVLEIVTNERLGSTLVLPDASAIDSLVDSTDVAIHIQRGEHFQSCLPPLVLEALALGKPVLVFHRTPVGTLLSELNPRWACKSVEDFVGECRNFRSQMAQLEQIGTEVARFARSHFRAESIASQYRSFYERVLP
jgi:hypothetical protein